MYRNNDETEAQFLVRLLNTQRENVDLLVTNARRIKELKPEHDKHPYFAPTHPETYQTMESLRMQRGNIVRFLETIARYIETSIENIVDGEE